MLKEVIIVEGKQDIVAVKKAVDAEIIATGGFALAPYTVNRIRQAYEKRGIIILTDPDSAGERIRKRLTQLFPDAKHAFVPKKDASANNDIGIEQASPQAIQAALGKVRYAVWEPNPVFEWIDVVNAGLTGIPDASERRAKLGELLGIGYANSKAFFYRMNHYGVTREEFRNALNEMEVVMC